MKNITKILAILLVICMCLSFAACTPADNENTNNDNTDTSGNSTENNGTEDSGSDDKETVQKVYTVTVKGPNGEPVQNVQVYIHKGEADFALATLPVKTDADGVASFTLEEASDYSVQLISVEKKYIIPDGSKRAGRYDMGDDGLDIVLELNPDYIPVVFNLGDKMVDFTITDIDGNVYNLNDLLEEKDMVMLNFWFYDCGWCAKEFPAINAAYANYTDSVQILAIDDTGSYPLYKVESYEEDMGLDLDFPLFKVDGDKIVTLGKFGTNYYPATVIIDRTGTICLIEIGAIVDQSLWDNAFAYFTADDYTQQLFKSITDIPDVTE